METITLTLTATVTDEDYAAYARNLDVSDVPHDLASYLEHNLLRGSSIADEYLSDITAVVAATSADSEVVRS